MSRSVNKMFMLSMAKSEEAAVLIKFWFAENLVLRKGHNEGCTFDVWVIFAQPLEYRLLTIKAHKDTVGKRMQ